LVGTFGNGLLRFNVKAERVTHNFVPTRDPRSISSNAITTMFQDRQGTLWIGTWGGGLNKLVRPLADSSASAAGGLERTVATFTRYQHDPNDPHSLSGNEVRWIDEDANGELWFLAGADGSSNQLNRFNPQTSQVTRHPIGLSNRLVSVLIDRSGLIWAGSWNDGLFKLNPGALKFPHYTMQPDEPNSFYRKFIRAICEDRNGNIWLGGEMEGLYRFDRQSGKYTYYKNDPAHRDSLSATWIYAILEDRNGAIWIGSDNGGLHKFDPGKKVFKRYRHDPQNPHSLALNAIASLLEDHSGVLWVGTWNGVLHRFDPATETFTRYREFVENNDWYVGSGIISIVEDNQGVLWLGTNNGGLVKFDAAIGKLKGFKKNSLEESSLIRPLIDRVGRLWYGGLSIGGIGSV
jgi:ligand-binding sensor domain-containing protein